MANAFAVASIRMCGGPVSPWQRACRLIATLPDNPPSLNPISSPSHLPNLRSVLMHNRVASFSRTDPTAFVD